MKSVVFRFQVFVKHKNRLTNRLLVLITFHFKPSSIDIQNWDEFILLPPQETDKMYTLRRKLCRKDILAGTTKTDIFLVINLKSTRWHKKGWYSPDWSDKSLWGGGLWQLITMSQSRQQGVQQRIIEFRGKLNPKTMKAFLVI